MSLEAEVLVPLTPEEEARIAEREAMEVLTNAKAVVVSTDEDYRDAGKHLATIKALIKQVEARRVAITGPINASLKLINEGFKRPKETLEAALGCYERPMVGYQRELEKKRKEAEEAARKEQERIQAEAKAKAAEEEARLKAAWADAEEAKKKAAAAQEADDPLAALLAEEEAADAEEAARLAMVATQDAVREVRKVEAPVVHIPVATAAGTAYRKTWKFKIVDASLIPRGYLIPDEQSIGLYARTEKENANIPGIEFFTVDSIGGR